LRVPAVVVWVYVAVVAATVVALLVLAGVAPQLATDEAWGHEIIVAVFAVVLPLRLRAARRGGPRALRAVVIIGGVLIIVNVVEAVIPGLFPAWMRLEMILIAVLMAVLVVSGVRALHAR